jgi:hypothetical protein
MPGLRWVGRRSDAASERVAKHGPGKNKVALSREIVALSASSLRAPEQSSTSRIKTSKVTSPTNEQVIGGPRSIVMGVP